jgi:tetratricopeptide (TPR) repeat protein
MRLALVAALLVLASPVDAQTYGLPTPAPRTTDTATLIARAHEREVFERFARGLAAEDRADWTAAVEEFTHAIALDPAEPRGSTAEYDLGIALAHQGNNRSAIAAFSEALHRDPGFAAAAANLVEVALRDGDIATARRAADRYVAIVPTSLRARYQHGLVALRGNDLVTARADFDALVLAAPAYAIAHYDLAVIAMRDGHDDTARGELDRALTLSPSYALARFARALLAVRDGRRDDARTDLTRVETDALDPSLRDMAAVLRDRLARAGP